MKKILICLLIICVLFLSGCEKKTKREPVIIDGEPVDTTTMKHQHCTRGGELPNGTADLTYEVYSTGDVLNLLISNEKVTTDDQDTLESYKTAYEEIHAYYSGLDYYDAKVETGSNYVQSIITINYDKIDIQKLLDIEGESDNIVEDGKAKLSKWMTLAKKFGTTCEEVED